MNTHAVKTSCHRRVRGSAYLLVLTTAVIVTTVGLSALALARVQNRVQRISAASAEARFYAVSAIDNGLFLIQQNPDPATWRSMLSNNGGFPLLNKPVGSGTFILQAVDPVDGDLTNNNSDPVQLTGIGYADQAVFKFQVQLDGSGKPVAGTWRRVVD